MIRRHVRGGWTFLYFQFLADYGREPHGFDDFMDGLGAAAARAELDLPRRQGLMNMFGA